jgi:metallo-beta-lactamase family protein
MSLSLTTWGGAETVTGANFLLEHAMASFLVDCGLEQGDEVCRECNFEDFPYDPSAQKALIVTHAHLDHVGRIPKLVREGFKGAIYGTPPTRDLARLILEDSLSILTKEAIAKNLPPLYEKEDVEEVFRLWKDVPYHERVELGTGLSFQLLDAGHILGSSMVEITFDGKKLVLTGDLGNSPSPYLRDTEKIEGADYLLMESVYGDKNHEQIEDRVPKLRTLIAEALHRGGAILIPAFSMERTEQMLYEISNGMEAGHLPKVPVYLDSPLAIRVIDVYRRYAKDYFKDDVQAELRREGDIFNFPMLTKTESRELSETIDGVPNPKIIIAGAGMSHGGRIQKHEIRHLPDPNSTLFIVGYQAPGSFGRRLQDGAKKIRINGIEVSVRARVQTLTGFSAHKDRDHLVEFVADTADTVKKVFVTMGEPKTSLFLTQRLREYLGVNAVVPTKGEKYILE